MLGTFILQRIFFVDFHIESRENDGTSVLNDRSVSKQNYIFSLFGNNYLQKHRFKIISCNIQV